MSRIQGSALRKAIFGGLVALSLSSAAVAQKATPADGNSSRSWQAYVFMAGDMKCIQINNQDGATQAVVCVPGGKSIALQVGADGQANEIATSRPASRVISGATQTIYQDDQMTVTATPQNDGTVVFAAQNDCNAYTCTGGRSQRRSQ